MAQEWDREFMPPIMQKGFTLSLGMAFKSFEMVKSPQATWSKMTGELKQMVTIPEDAGDGVQAKAKALAAVWMEKGMTAVEACRAAGRKFTGDE